MSELRELMNIGKVLETDLQRAGICSAEDLEKLGSRAAFQQVKVVRPDACLRVLYALEGAILGIQDIHLPPEVKESLKVFFYQEQKH